MSRRRAGFHLDPATGRPVRPVGPARSPLVLPGQGEARSAIVPTLPGAGRPMPGPGMPPLEELVPFLMNSGMPVNARFAATNDGQIFLALSVGKIMIPLAVSVAYWDENVQPAIDKARSGALEALAAQKDADGLPPIPEGCEDLLEEFTARADMYADSCPVPMAGAAVPHADSLPYRIPGMAWQPGLPTMLDSSHRSPLAVPDNGPDHPGLPTAGASAGDLPASRLILPAEASTDA